MVITGNYAYQPATPVNISVLARGSEVLLMATLFLLNRRPTKRLIISLQLAVFCHFLVSCFAGFQGKWLLMTMAVLVSVLTQSIGSNPSGHLLSSPALCSLHLLCSVGLTVGVGGGGKEASTGRKTHFGSVASRQQLRSLHQLHQPEKAGPSHKTCVYCSGSIARNAVMCKWCYEPVSRSNSKRP